jgi:hypothetical protein
LIGLAFSPMTLLMYAWLLEHFLGATEEFSFVPVLGIAGDVLFESRRCLEQPACDSKHHLNGFS